MEYFKLKKSERTGYYYIDGNSVKMCLLGNFLQSDVGCGDSSFREWIFNDDLGYGVGGNVTFLEKEGDYIFLTDLYSEEKVPTELQMTRTQLAVLMDEWQEKVCKTKPKKVTIKCENNRFFIETSG